MWNEKREIEGRERKKAEQQSHEGQKLKRKLAQKCWWGGMVAAGCPLSLTPRGVILGGGEMGGVLVLGRKEFSESKDPGTGFLPHVLQLREA